MEHLYYVKEVLYKDVKDILMNHHYRHAQCSATKIYGLFTKDENKLIGTCVWGLPSSRAVAKGVCGEDEALKVIELKRLFIFDVTPKNTESWFLGQILKVLPYEILLSFAEPSAGHLGTIYQATNWMFCGTTIKSFDYKLKGDDRHPRSLTEFFNAHGGSAKAYETLGADIIERIPRSRKYRYIKFNVHSKKRYKELMSKLRYDTFEYPKTTDLEEFDKQAVITRSSGYKYHR